MLKYLRNKSVQGLLLLLAVALAAFYCCLPQPLFNEPYSAVLLGHDDQLLGAKIAADGQWRFPETDAIPEKYKIALIHFEDKRFNYHLGFDPLAFVRALYLNIKHHRIVSGGSTISMQVVRLARSNPERSYIEKLIEIIWALRLELSHSKDEILAFYANHAPYGGNVVGLEAAAWRYFGRSPETLTWAESAMLAVLPNNPSLLHPGRNRDSLRAKRDRLLQQLHQQGVLSELEWQLARAERLPHKPLVLPRLAPHLLDTLIARTGNSKPRLQTTLNKRIQLAAVDVVKQHALQLSLREIKNVAALVVDNDLSEVQAYVGNSYTEIAAHDGYAVDIVQSPRSSGSTLKPLLFAAMLQAGEILPTTLVPDVPAQYSGYMPENYDRRYRGAVPARVALARSLNVPAVHMLHRHGVSRFYDFLQHLGMTTLFRPPPDYGLTLILGGAESTLWDLATMYSNLAMLAKQTSPLAAAHYVRLKVMQDDSASTDRLADISPATAWITLQSLLEVNRPGDEGHWRKFSSSQKIAWKTGTSYGLRDAWAIGTTARYTVAVWVGNADGEGRPDLVGLSTAAPVMFDIFNQLESSPWFKKPVAGLKKVEVCKNDGYLANGHCDSATEWIPEISHFEIISPHNRLVHLDRHGNWRVHSQCEQIAQMRHVNWFSLPPAQEYYYRQSHSDYRPLPQYRDDCQRVLAGAHQHGPIDLLYPAAGTRIYIPIDLGQIKSRTVFEAVHRDADAVLFWHLDDTYIGETQYFHQQALDVDEGRHQVVVVDQQGNRLARTFEVLVKQSEQAL